MASAQRSAGICDEGTIAFNIKVQRTSVGGVLTHHHHIFKNTDTTLACTQSKMGIEAYLGSVHNLRVDTVIILLYVTNITSNIHLNQ